MVEIPPFDAWTFVGGEVEPLGSHRTLAAALDALGHLDGGCVTTGMTFLRWHERTSEAAKAPVRRALQAHGMKAAAKPEGDFP